jgi:hypothetical protein
MHFAHADNVGGQEIETVLIAAFLTQLKLSSGIFSGDRGDRREEQMRTIGHPIYPSAIVRYGIVIGRLLKFSEIRFPAVDVDPASQIRVIRRIFRQEKFGPRNLKESSFDGVQLRISESFISLDRQH